MQITTGDKWGERLSKPGVQEGFLCTSSQVEALVRTLAQLRPGFTFSVRSAVGKDMGDRPMALWMW